VRPIPHTDLRVFPICLGGNVFGWTADERASFDVLDAYTAAGGNFLDTSDSYMASAPGNSGGESETIIGRWLARRRHPDDVLVATKVSRWERHPGLSAKSITEGAEDSLRRLGVEAIDLYYAHYDDPDTPQEETLAAFDSLVRAGKVRYIAASNHTPERLESALRISEREGLARYVALQPHYNLMERAEFELDLAPVITRHELAVFPYFGLAKGFLTGKYRDPAEASATERRAAGARAYDDERGRRVLAALDDVAAAQGISVAAAALAWLAAQPGITAPIASARNTNQLPALLAAAETTLSPEQLDALTAASDARVTTQ
jgi:aryl-alcohol dehydrogenase-like predicted oxidoreductase